MTVISNRAGKHEFSLEWRWVVIWDACLGWRVYYNHDGHKKGDDDNGGDHIGDVDVEDDNDDDDDNYDDDSDDHDENDVLALW